VFLPKGHLFAADPLRAAYLVAFMVDVNAGVFFA
jgi:hypothetical protein